jgi:hypothetical protein
MQQLHVGHCANRPRVVFGRAIRLALLRSGFTAIPLERLAAPTTEQSIALWTNRLRMTRTALLHRWIVDQAG